MNHKLTVLFATVVLSLTYLERAYGQLPCTDNYEPNDEKKHSAPVEPGVAFFGLMQTTLDVDWFRFTVHSDTPNIRIRLFHLPKDYNIFLHDSTGLIAKSKNEGTVSDTIVMNGLASGTYFLKVRARAGQTDPTNCYALIVRSSTDPFKEVVGVGTTEAQFELYPNPASDKLNILCDDEISSATISVFNLLGQKISEKTVPLDEDAGATIDVSSLHVS